MAKVENYSSTHQYEMLELAFYRPLENGTPPEKTKWVDLSPMVEELDIFEDVMVGSVTGQLMINDAYNLPDRFPIVGGERLKIRFKTPTIDREINLTMVIYKVGERFKSKASDKTQSYWLYLCTEDQWNSNQMDLSFSNRSTYAELVTRVLGMLQTTKPKNIESTVGINTFISPYWSPLRICEFAASRATTEQGDPMFFWETTDAYNLRSLKSLFDQAPQKRIFIEPRNTNAALEHGDKMFNVVLDWNYAAGDDKLTLNKNGSFGKTVKVIDTVNWNITQEAVTPEAIDVIRIDKYPIADIKSQQRSKSDEVYTQADGSHLTEARKRAILDKLDNKRIVVSIPGDSSVHAGQLIELDVPSITGGNENTEERVASGKFFCASARHIIIRDRYRLNLELLKNATEKQVV